MSRLPRIKILYSSILHRNITLVSHQDDDSETYFTHQGGFTQLLNEVLESRKEEQISPVAQRFTYPVENFQTHVLIERGIMYLCITVCTDTHYLPFSFLQKVRDAFSEQSSLISRSYRAKEDELDRDFAPVLRNIMDSFNSGQGDNISQIMNDIVDVKQIMLHNIETMMERGERLDDLINKTADLQSEGQEFRRQARVIHTRERWKNIKLWLVIAAIVVIVVTLIVLFACGYLHF